MKLIQNAYYLLIGFFLLIITQVSAQDQKVADSLHVYYLQNDQSTEERMDLLQKLAYNELNDLEAALNYSNELIELASAEKHYFFLFEGYLNKGNTHRVLGNLDLALDALFKSSEAAKNYKKEHEAVSYIAIADVYSEMGNANNAELYYDKGISILRELDEPLSLASALFNAGDEFFNSKKYTQAIRNFEEAGSIFENENYPIGSAYTLGNIGMIYAEQGNHSLAEAKINQAVEILEDLEDYYGISEYLTYMSDIYLKQNDWKTAVIYAQRSLDLAKKNRLKKQISDSNLKLSELYQQAGNAEQAYTYYKDHIVYRDSVINLENIEKAADLRTNFEVSQEQAKTMLSEQKRKNQRIIVYATAGALFLIGLLAFGLYRRNRYVQRTNKIIANEKERSDSLLLNILPEETAKELKEKGKVKAKKYDSVTVLFTDFKGFTKYAENLPPEKLVEAVDHYFSKFDEIIKEHDLEKIKTVGDAYMCAGGLNSSGSDHAERMVKAAMDMVEFVNATKHDDSIDTSFDVRIGINTGPVVAGVVGTRKFAYDIWGDTVNIASRMESNSEPGKINISDNTYKIIKDYFQCEYRGKLEVKNRGELKMYFVNAENSNH